MKKKTGRKRSRLERGYVALLGDRKTTASKITFGTNLVLTVLCTGGVFAVAANAQYDNKWTANDVMAAAAFGLMALFQGSEVNRKTGTQYWWVIEPGSKAFKEAKK